jgi:hypothetical protein
MNFIVCTYIYIYIHGHRTELASTTPTALFLIFKATAQGLQGLRVATSNSHFGFGTP